MTPSESERIGESRLLGVEDGSFNAFSRDTDSHTFLCGVSMTGGRIEDVLISRIEVDGFDATEKLLGMLNGVEADAIILGGITFAGFNIIDPSLIFNEIGMPVIIYSGKKPDDEEMLFALKKHFDDWMERWKIVEGLGEVSELVVRPCDPPVYFETVGGSKEWAEVVLRSSALVCRIPEPVRVAGLVARGLSRQSC